MTAPDLSPRLRSLVARFEELGNEIHRRDAAGLLASSEVELDDVAAFVRESAHGYTRQRIARTEHFEMLVMTWRAGQGSAPHDHAGSLCALKILRGGVHETRFGKAPDGLVDPLDPTEVRAGEVVVDVSEHVHSLRNDSENGETLVTLHVYAPPLPELRRYAARPAGHEPSAPFLRPRAPDAATVAIVGAGFSGTLVATHLLRLATETRVPLHVVLLDRQAAFGEGAAYRTADGRHLLNVPAGNMSARPDRPNDFYDWAKARDGAIAPTDFLPRKTYGEYLRATFFDEASRAGDNVSAEVRRAEARSVIRDDRGWVVGAGIDSIDADAVVLASGHRPPDCPIGQRWVGSRARYIEDPWASLALSAIAPDEPVVLLGTSLTAIDVLLTLTRAPRTASVLALSRRGMLPFPHASAPVGRRDPTAWLEPMLAAPGGPTARGLLRGLRDSARAAASEGQDWRAVIDGLRPHTARIWQSLAPREAARFMRHARGLWEVRRHRMPPTVASHVRDLEETGVFSALAARVLSARADTQGVTLEVRRRGSNAREQLRAAWVVNCTGPGAGSHGLSLVPALGSLIEAGHLEADPMGLGVRTGDAGRARANGVLSDDLFVVGTLRKPDLWESTAVPELREQALAAAKAVLDGVVARRG